MTTMPPSIKLYTLQAAYYLLPNLEKFNIRNDVIYNKVPSSMSLFLTTLYALCFAVIIFIITTISFRKKEF